MSNELLQEFLIESFENLGSISERITRLESSPEDLELVNDIYRTLHTLKGSANLLNFPQIQAVAHASESVLDFVREGLMVVRPPLIDGLLRASDACLGMLQAIEQNGTEGNLDGADIALEILSIGERTLGGRGTALPSGRMLFHNTPEKNIGPIIYKEEDAEVKDEIFKVAGKNERLMEEDSKSSENIQTKSKDKAGPKREEVSMLDSSTKLNHNGAVTGQDGGHHAPKKTSENVSSVADSVVKVNVNLLDKIMNQVGELVLNRNQILQFANQHNNNDLQRLVQQLNLITSELQTDIMTTRMQPIGNVFSKFERTIRDLSRETGKKVRLNASGKETELDKTLLEAIKDPLTHIIRNSVDHGIESPSEREASGKTPEGTVEIKAYHESGQVMVEVTDNGRGLNKAKILQKAIEKGVISKEESETVSDERAFSLIFAPGFSTAEKVTNISGRGVGMDVVKTNIEKIGGSVEVSSRFGEGSKFKLKIPLTLAIVPALIIACGDENFAIPQNNLVELVRHDFSAEKDSKIERIHDSLFIRLREKIIPLFFMDKTLGLELSEGERSELNLVVLNAEGVTFALVVDDILNTEEIVVKPFGKSLKNQSVFAGATIMGDGKVALILDALGFFKHVSPNFEKMAQSKEEEPVDLSAQAAEFQENLLFKLKDGNRYCLPLSLVHRLEEFKASDLEMTGEQAIIKYDERPMPLINIEKNLGYDGHDEIIAPGRERFSCLVVKVKGQLYGLVVEEILDISVTEDVIDSSAVDRAGILGTIFVNSGVVSLIDPYELVGKSMSYRIEPETVVKELRGKKVLLVDDSSLYRKMEGEALEELGAEVVYGKNGQEGLERLRKSKFDLIITDIEMPVMDGYSFGKALREEFGANIPVLALSTRVSVVDIAKGKESGFDSHIEKFKKDEMIEKVIEMIGEKERA